MTYAAQAEIEKNFAAENYDQLIRTEKTETSLFQYLLKT